MGVVVLLVVALFGVGAVGHTPRFPRNEDVIDIDGEPSAAIYVRGGTSTTFNVRYTAGDALYTTVFVTSRTYDRLRKHPERGPVVYGVGECSSGEAYDDLTAHEVGEVFYEMFGETELVVHNVVMNGTTSATDQTCTFGISSGVEYVVGLGTTEEVLGTMAIGLPIILMRISSWMGVYTYGLWFVIGIVPLWLYTQDGRRTVAGIFFLSALNRWILIGLQTGGSFPYGMFFTFVPILLSAGVTSRWGEKRWPVGKKGIIWLVAVVTPTRSWIDVGALTALYAWEWRSGNT